MTAAPTNTRMLDIDTMVQDAAQESGVLALGAGRTSPSWPDIGTWGRNALERFIKGLSARGGVVRTVELYDLDVSAGTAEYPLAADTVNVLNTAMWRDDGSNIETPVMPMTREEYVAITDKTSQAQPARYYLERGRTVVLYFDTVPVVDGTLRVQRERALADSSTGTFTPDLEAMWMPAIHAELTYAIAKMGGVSVERCLMLKQDAREALSVALSAAQTDQPARIRLNHPTPWSR